ncbi:MAG: hypothetical protein P8008_04950 [Gammaproteobacteria bacterium]
MSGWAKRAAATVLATALAVPGAAHGASGDSAAPLFFAGHLKGQGAWTRIPGDSALGEALGSSATDLFGETRLRLGLGSGPWSAALDYQLLAIEADTLRLGQSLSPAFAPFAAVVDDRRRWFDLTHVIDERDTGVLLQRLDRVSVTYSGERLVWRFGRQAISWGNGLLFTPMDVFNPFDPATVDREYKPGDDMLYGQYLFADGSDLQAVAVVRRDPVSGDTTDQGSLAFKYHGFAGRGEFDLLAARHFDQPLLAVGGNLPVGDALWRGDLTWTDTDHGATWSAVASLSRSWTWGGRNVSGVLELYRNGFGQRDGRYAPAELAANPELLQRLARGELFTLGRNYLAASLLVEWHPLLQLTPNLFVNLDDPSALAQLVLRWDWRQDLQLLAALNLPVGPAGSEYGGPPSGEPGEFLETGAGLFAQLAWYFQHE